MYYLDAHTHTHHLTHSLFNVIVGRDNLVSESFYSVGIHPWYVEDSLQQFEILTELVQDPKCLAIGECGLDKLCTTPFDIQEVVFRNQIQLAMEVQKPLIIHCVKAIDELLKMKAEFSNSVPWIIHGFNQKPEIAKRLISQGFYFSLGHALLNKNSNASACLSFLPIEHLLLETDEAEIAIGEVYNAAAMGLNLSESELVFNLQANFERVFGRVI